jgi:hypothetical protein
MSIFRVHPARMSTALREAVPYCPDCVYHDEPGTKAGFWELCLKHATQHAFDRIAGAE